MQEGGFWSTKSRWRCGNARRRHHRLPENHPKQRKIPVSLPLDHRKHVTLAEPAVILAGAGLPVEDHREQAVFLPGLSVILVGMAVILAGLAVTLAGLSVIPVGTAVILAGLIVSLERLSVILLGMAVLLAGLTVMVAGMTKSVCAKGTGLDFGSNGRIDWQLSCVFDA